MTRIFVLEPELQDIWGNYAHYGRLVELPSGQSFDLPYGIRESANSRKPLAGRNLREFLEQPLPLFNLSPGEPFWVVWEGRAILMPAKD